MLKLRNYDEIISEYTPKVILSKYSLQKLPLYAQQALTVLAGNEISCDCRFENDDGKFLYNDRDDADNFVLIASSGQGDEWLLNIFNNSICFLDHDKWEETDALCDTKLSFDQFVVMADLFKQYERISIPQESDITLLKKCLDCLSEGLSQRFPFNFY